MQKTEKILFVQDLAEKLKGAKSVAVVDYTNLKSEQMGQVRDALREVPDVEFEVVKNSLFKKALEMAGKKWEREFEGKLAGQSALVISFQDEVAPLSVLAKLAKSMGSLGFKLGFAGERILEENELTVLANLPSRKTLEGQVVNRLASPISGLVYSLNWNLGKLVRVISAIRESKSVSA